MNDILHVLTTLGGLAKEDLVELLTEWNTTLESKLITLIIASLKSNNNNDDNNNRNSFSNSNSNSNNNSSNGSNSNNDSKSNSNIFDKYITGYKESLERVSNLVGDTIKRGVAIPTLSSLLSTMQLTCNVQRY
jgi:6-phosphogluconate dehydrogenase